MNLETRTVDLLFYGLSESFGISFIVTVSVEFFARHGGMQILHRIWKVHSTWI